MNFSEDIYKACPIFLQNILITAYGYKIKQARYGGDYRKYYESLCESQYHSSEDLRQIQVTLFRNLVDYVIQYIPFYKELFYRKNLSSLDVSINNYTSIFPLVTKELLRSSGSSFLSTDHARGKPLITHTSGTTGTPLELASYRSALQRNYAFFNRYLNWAGVQVGDRSATFAGRMFIPDKQQQPPFWRSNASLNNVLFSSYHISEKSIPAYIAALERFNPIFIDSYPSSINQIAEYIVNHDYQHRIHPAAIITSSETLLSHQRNIIETAFGCKVYDHLGSAEMVTFITQCEHGNYHINPEYGLIEVLDAQGNPSGEGVPGRLICTGLFNYAMPLIRYEIGDSIVLKSGACECGRHFPMVESILGRTDDLIVGCNGRKIGRLDPIFKGLGNSIKESQLIQTDLHNITLKIVTDNSYDYSCTKNIITELEKRVGNCIKVHVEYTDHIPRTSSGKFRSVISCVDHQSKSMSDIL